MVVDENRIAGKTLLCLVFAAVVIPTILPFHHYPQTVFDNEWVTVLIVLAISMVGALRRDFRFNVSTLSVALFTLFVASILSELFVAKAMSLSMFGVAFYFLFLFLCISIAQRVTTILGGTVFIPLAALGFLVCALLHCLVSVAQINGWDVNGMVMPKLLNSVYGNIAQPNHFGNLLWLGLVSGMYLWAQGRLQTWAALIFAAILCVFSALSASRAVLLYTAAIPVLAIVFWYRAERAERWRVWGAVAVLAALSIAAQLWVGFGGAKLVGVASSLGRLNDPGSNTQRLFDWSVAWQTSLQHPLTGSGVGSFAWQTALHSIGLPPATVVRIGENAHNTILNSAAEYGWLVTGTVLVLIVLWLVRRLREKPTLESFWALGILTVIGAHSMVEYPLWYTYFLLPAGFAIGVIDAGDKGLPVIAFSRNWLILPLAAGVFILGWTYHDYMRLEEGYRIVNADDDLSASDLKRIDELAGGVSRYSMFATHAGILRLRAWQTSAVDKSKDMAALCDSAVRVKPSYTVLAQCVTAYALQKRQADSALMVDVICGAFPPEVRQELPKLVRSAYGRQGWAVPVKTGCL